MAFVRIPAAATGAFDLEALKLHARVDTDDEDTALQLMGRTATHEIEAYCDIALLRQTIIVTVDVASEPVLLPVGPLAPDAVVSIDGEPINGAVTAGRYPALTFPDDITGTVSVSYEAGYGDEPSDIPADLQYAVIDHASRLYDVRGADDGEQGLSVAAARICARYRRVRT